MKQISTLTILLAALLLTSVSGYSQNKAFEKGFTLKLQYTAGGDDFGGMKDYWENYAEDQGTPVIEGTKWRENKAGFGLKIGTMFFLNSIDFHDQMRIGIDVTYMGFNYLASEFDLPISAQGETFNMHNIYFNPEVGPSFSYSPVENMAIDFAYKISPTVAVNVANYSYDNGTSTEDDTFVGFGFGVRHGPALYFRYSPLLVGVQYNMGNINQSISSDNLDTFSNRTSYASTDVIIGFKF